MGQAEPWMVAVQPWSAYMMVLLEPMMGRTLSWWCGKANINSSTSGVVSSSVG